VVFTQHHFLMALSSNGQDEWFSAIKSGFDSPWGYHFFGFAEKNGGAFEKASS
jgi:hypothetical protein